MILNTGQRTDIPAFFPYLELVKDFGQFWYVTITPYEKVKRNFPQAREVSDKDKLFLGRAIIKIAADHGMTVKPCGEADFLAPYGADCGGCMTIRDYERAIGKKLKVPNYKPSRKECACYLSADIGAYDTCCHYCKYCYANNDLAQVAKNQKLHDPTSPFLIGGSLPGDKLHIAEQKSWVDNQLELGFE